MTKEINADNMNASIDHVLETMQREVDTYGDNASVPLTMSLMTYVAARLLVGYFNLTKCTPSELITDHLTALKQSMALMDSASVNQKDLH